MEDWESCCSSSEGANRTRGNWKTENHHTISLNTPLEKNAPHVLFGLFGVRRCSAFCTSRFRNPPTVARSVWPGNGGALPIVSRKRSSGFRFYKPLLHFCIHRAQTFGIRVPPPNEIRCVIERVCDTGMKQRMKDSDAVTHCSSKFLKIGKVDETGSIFLQRKKTHANYETILFANICSDVYQFVSIVLRRLDHGWTYCIRKNSLPGVQCTKECSRSSTDVQVFHSVPFFSFCENFVVIHRQFKCQSKVCKSVIHMSYVGTCTHRYISVQMGRYAMYACTRVSCRNWWIGEPDISPSQCWWRVVLWFTLVLECGRTPSPSSLVAPNTQATSTASAWLFGKKIDQMIRRLFLEWWFLQFCSDKYIAHRLVGSWNRTCPIGSWVFERALVAGRGHWSFPMISQNTFANLRLFICRCLFLLQTFALLRLKVTRFLDEADATSLSVGLKVPREDIG